MELALSIFSGGAAGLAAAFALFKWWLAYRKDKELLIERVAHEQNLQNLRHDQENKIKEMLHAHQIEIIEIQRKNSELLEGFKKDLIKYVEKDKSSAEISKAMALQHRKFEYEAAHEALRLMAHSHNSIAVEVMAGEEIDVETLKKRLALQSDDVLKMYLLNFPGVHELTAKYIEGLGSMLTLLGAKGMSEDEIKSEMGGIFYDMALTRTQIIKKIIDGIKGYRDWKEWV
jgi:hypothetical protein